MTKEEKPKTAGQASKCIKRAFQCGEIITLPHAKKALQDENLSDLDLSSSIRGGWVDQMEWEEHDQSWRYGLIGPLAEPQQRKRLRVIFKILPGDRVPVITVFTVRVGR